MAVTAFAIASASRVTIKSPSHHGQRHPTMSRLTCSDIMLGLPFRSRISYVYSLIRLCRGETPHAQREFSPHVCLKGIQTLC